MALEIPAIIKDNWPMAVGGIVGIYLILKFMGSKGSSTPAPVIAGGMDSTAYAAMANANAAVQTAQIQAASKAAEIQAQNDAMNTQAAIINNQNNNAAQIAFVQTQGQVAQSVGSAAQGIITALELPSIQAMNSAAAQNNATLDAAAKVAESGFLSQAAISSSALQNVTALSGLVASSNQTMASAIGGNVQTANAGSQALANTTNSVINANAQSGINSTNVLGTLTMAALFA